MEAPWPHGEFEAQVRARESGHPVHHPFNIRLNRGALQPFQVRGWVANRFYYQVCIPVTAGRDDRRSANADDIEAWLRLGEAVGLRRQALWSQEHVVPGVRFAVQAYVNFARRAPWQEGVISSLTAATPLLVGLLDPTQPRNNRGTKRS